MKIIYDIDTNGLVDTVSNIWIAVTKNIETNKIVTFSDYDPNSKPLNELIPYLNKAEVLIGHNIIAYDNDAAYIYHVDATTDAVAQVAADILPLFKLDGVAAGSLVAAYFLMV